MAKKEANRTVADWLIWAAGQGMYEFSEWLSTNGIVCIILFPSPIDHQWLGAVVERTHCVLSDVGTCCYSLPSKPTLNRTG